jgi:hypothetical protein
MASVTSKSLITPSLRGLMALIEPGVLPNISRATSPTASPLFRTMLVPLRTATTEGSLRTMPLSRTQTRVEQVPRSIPMSILNKPNRISGSIFDSLHNFHLSGANSPFIADRAPKSLVGRLWKKATLRRFVRSGIPAMCLSDRRYYRNGEFLGPI